MMKTLFLSLLSLVFAATEVQAAAPAVKPDPAAESEVPTLFETKATAPSSEEPKRPVSDLDRELEKTVLDLIKKQAVGTEDANPLLRVGRRMREVEGRITETQVGEETQSLQRQIVEDLDALIQQARNQQPQGCPKCNDGSCADCQKAAKQAGKQQQAKPNNSGKQQQQGRKEGQAREAAREASKGRPIAAKLGAREAISKMSWGHLPPALQKLMNQVEDVVFLPKYEPLIEQYYKTLAEQDPGR